MFSHPLDTYSLLIVVSFIQRIRWGSKAHTVKKAHSLETVTVDMPVGLAVTFPQSPRDLSYIILFSVLEQLLILSFNNSQLDFFSVRRALANCSKHIQYAKCKCNTVYKHLATLSPRNYDLSILKQQCIQRGIKNARMVKLYHPNTVQNIDKYRKKNVSTCGISNVSQYI